MRNRRILGALIFIIGATIWFLYTNRSVDLKAIDNNQDGVWDDLEPFIKKRGKTEKQKTVLRVWFREHQKWLEHPEIGKQIKAGTYPHYGIQLLDCLHRMHDADPAFPVLDEVRDVILSNAARVRAHIRYNSNLSGLVSGLWESKVDGDSCAFPPGLGK